MATRTQSKSADLYEVEQGDCFEQTCPICDRVSDSSNNDHACRVCGRVYHRECCKIDGNYQEFDLSTMERAFTNVGWSCLECDNIANRALTVEDNGEICNIFDTYDKNDDGSITLEEYLAACKHILERDLTPEELSEEKEYFNKMDRDKSGEIELSEFLAHEAPRYISKYDKEELVKMLTPLEKKSAKRIFNLLDRNKDGEIDYWEAISRTGLTGWYGLFQRLKDIKHLDDNENSNKSSQPCLRKKKISSVGQHLIPQTLSVRQCDENLDGKVTWPEFLRGHALDIILARPNKSDRAVALLQ